MSRRAASSGHAAPSSNMPWMIGSSVVFGGLVSHGSPPGSSSQTAFILMPSSTKDHIATAADRNRHEKIASTDPESQPEIDKLKEQDPGAKTQTKNTDNFGKDSIKELKHDSTHPSDAGKGYKGNPKGDELGSNENKDGKKGGEGKKEDKKEGGDEKGRDDAAEKDSVQRSMVSEAAEFQPVLLWSTPTGAHFAEVERAKGRNGPGRRTSREV